MEESNNIVQLNLRPDAPFRLKDTVMALEAELAAKEAEAEYYKLKTEAVVLKLNTMFELLSIMLVHDPNAKTENGESVLDAWRKTAAEVIRTSY